MANQVTTFTAETDVVIGGKRVPAGRYTVYVHAPDRLARKYIRQVLLRGARVGHGCRVVFVDRPLRQDPHHGRAPHGGEVARGR